MQAMHSLLRATLLLAVVGVVVLARVAPLKGGLEAKYLEDVDAMNEIDIQNSGRGLRLEPATWAAILGVVASFGAPFIELFCSSFGLLLRYIY